MWNYVMDGTLQNNLLPERLNFKAIEWTSVDVHDKVRGHNVKLCHGWHITE